VWRGLLRNNPLMRRRNAPLGRCCLTRSAGGPIFVTRTSTLREGMATESPSAIDMSSLPLLPLTHVVVFPHMVIPLFVGRPASLKALDVAMDTGKHILLVAQKSAAKDD